MAWFRGVAAVGCCALARGVWAFGHAFPFVGVPEAVLAGGGYHVEGANVLLSHNSGMSLVSSLGDGSDPSSLVQLKLLGKRLSFAVDLSRVGCACNLAVYLISMPARGWDGRPSPGEDRGGQPPYYCDANQVGGQWCPEIDIMEANDHAFAATPHKCDAPVNGHYESCDRGSCGQNTRDRPDSYGPGAGFVIDTRRPFEVHTDFVEDGGTFARLRTTLSQESREVVLEGGCERWYMEQLSEALKVGMSLRISYWGGAADTMSWLDTPPCGGEQCSAGKAVVGRFGVFPLGIGSPAGWASIMRRYSYGPILGEEASAGLLGSSTTASLMVFAVLFALTGTVLAAARARRMKSSAAVAAAEGAAAAAAVRAARWSGQTFDSSSLPVKYTAMERGGAASPPRTLSRRPASLSSDPEESAEVSPHRRRPREGVRLVE